MKRRGKSRGDWGTRLFAILGLFIIFTMVLALVISALQSGP